jgi:anthranilate synthase
VLYHFLTRSGIAVERRATALPYAQGIDAMLERLDTEPGGYLASSFEATGRYHRYAVGFVAPPLEITSADRRLNVTALNPRGEQMLPMLRPVLAGGPDTQVLADGAGGLRLTVAKPAQSFSEEERSRQYSVFTPLRRLLADFAGIQDQYLGLWGAFGYDLLFQFEDMPLRLQRPDRRDMHLFLPDQIYLIDHRREMAVRYDYEFTRGSRSTQGLERSSIKVRRKPAVPAADITSDYSEQEYASMVDTARESIARGDIFEVVLSRNFAAPYGDAPSELFRRMRAVNPSPYEFLFQLGRDQLVGTSPEMFVRVQGDRVETCPICGTIRRGGDAMQDADQVQALLNSDKDEVELTMCTDVDRNDKARVCRPGTVKLLGRRLLEAYAGLFHTVDHVEGRLRPGCDGIDAFLSHMWAVTLTGAPKPEAIKIIEESEKTARGWYGGAVGRISFDGTVDTGITIRTVRLEGGQAHYRAGATIVWDSVGLDEAQECRTKATVLFRALRPVAAAAVSATNAQPGSGRRVVLIDNRDSFVHNLADYFRQTGAEVVTYRYTIPLERLLALQPDLVLHSPGPGRPADTGVPALVRALAKANVPQFGVCLGLQGTVEAFGGALGQLEEPRHGKRWSVTHGGDDPVFDGLPSPMTVGAYHSLYAHEPDMPACLRITARNETGLIMAVRHESLPIAAVQFHPESILSLGGGVGHRLIANVIRSLAAEPRSAAAE